MLSLVIAVMYLKETRPRGDPRFSKEAEKPASIYELAVDRRTGFVARDASARLPRVHSCEEFDNLRPVTKPSPSSRLSAKMRSFFLVPQPVNIVVWWLVLCRHNAQRSEAP